MIFSGTCRQGGINTFTYVGGDPVSKVDPLGLLEQCRTGLPSTFGYDIGPAHHDYHCWTDANDKRICRGFTFDSTSNASTLDKIFGRTKGAIRKDEDNKTDGKETCTSDDGNKCMDKCVAGEWENLGTGTPDYGLVFSGSCQVAASNIYQKCKAQCSKK